MQSRGEICHETHAAMSTSRVRRRGRAARVLVREGAERAVDAEGHACRERPLFSARRCTTRAQRGPEGRRRDTYRLVGSRRPTALDAERATDAVHRRCSSLFTRGDGADGQESHSYLRTHAVVYLSCPRGHERHFKSRSAILLINGFKAVPLGTRGRDSEGIATSPNCDHRVTPTHVSNLSNTFKANQG